MCERRNRKIGKGVQAARLQEARRLYRLAAAAPALALAAGRPGDSAPVPSPRSVVDKKAQCRLILDLAIKTISLMHKNSLIQQKIIALRKETTEFVASVMSNPENKKRYLQHVNVYGSQVIQIQPQQSSVLNNIPLKLEPAV